MFKSYKKKFYETLEEFAIGSIEVCDKVSGKNKLISGTKAGQEAVIEIFDWSFLNSLIFKGELGFAEAYLSKKWDSPDLLGLTKYLAMNITELGDKKNISTGNILANLYYRFRNSFLRRNTLRGSINNIHAHYDLGNSFYKLWLDRTMTYSSGLFLGESTSLEQAQINKFNRILTKAGDGDNILEIGCGWGGFINESIKNNKNVYGITLSDQQYKYVSNRFKEFDNIKVAIQDYRDVTGKFDNIISIEMFEAVGREYWKTFYKKIKENLAKGGKAIIQTIYIDEKLFNNYVSTNDYVREYIFPGGFLPTIPRMEAVINDCRLKVDDKYLFGEDYSKTLTSWYKNFNLVSKKVIEIGFDETFIRKWKFYLAYCNSGFLSERIGVGQFEISHD